MNWLLTVIITDQYTIKIDLLFLHNNLLLNMSDQHKSNFAGVLYMLPIVHNPISICSLDIHL